MYRTDFWTLWEKARTASKHVDYLWRNRPSAQVGCMRQVLGPGALGRPRGIGWRGRREGGSGWGTDVNPWLIHVNVWQNPLQYCKVISLQLVKKKNPANSSGMKVISNFSISMDTACSAQGLCQLSMSKNVKPTKTISYSNLGQFKHESGW